MTEGELFDSSNPREILKLYLRMLYSEKYLIKAKAVLTSKSGSEIVNRFLRTVDFEILALEQTARAKNLIRHLLRAAPSLNLVIGNELRAQIVRDFIEGGVFWESRGRSLTENFCVFVIDRYSAHFSDFGKDAIKLGGLVSGMLASSNKASPWPDNECGSVANEADVKYAESFQSRYRMVDSQGNLPSESNIKSCSEEMISFVSVQELVNGRFIALSRPK